MDELRSTGMEGTTRPSALAMSSPSPAPRPRRQRRRRSRQPSSTRSTAPSEVQQKDTLPSVVDDDRGSSSGIGEGEMVKREEQLSPVELHRRRIGEARRRQASRTGSVKNVDKQDDEEEEASREEDEKIIGLRLDLNLDVVVTIKAKVHGDVTLSLLR